MIDDPSYYQTNNTVCCNMIGYHLPCKVLARTGHGAISTVGRCSMRAVLPALLYPAAWWCINAGSRLQHAVPEHTTNQRSQMALGSSHSAPSGPCILRMQQCESSNTYQHTNPIIADRQHTPALHMTWQDMPPQGTSSKAFRSVPSLPDTAHHSTLLFKPH